MRQRHPSWRPVFSRINMRSLHSRHSVMAPNATLHRNLRRFTYAQIRRMARPGLRHAESLALRARQRKVTGLGRRGGA